MAGEVPWLLPLQLLEMAVSFLAAFFFWDRIRELLGQGNVLLVLFGGVFFMVGSAASGLLLRDGNLWKGLLIGMLFSGLGLGLVILGLLRIFRPSPDLDDDQACAAAASLACGRHVGRT
jgi:hypothetical protein